MHLLTQKRLTLHFTGDLKAGECQSNLYIIYVKTIIVFYKFYDFFCWWHSLMNQATVL